MIEKLTHCLDKILEMIAIICISISAVIAIISVILRYQYGISFQVLEEVSRYSIVYGVFVYIGPLIKKGEHLKMDLLLDKLNEKSKFYLNLCINILLFFSFLLLFYASVRWSLSLLGLKVMSLSGSILLFVPALAVVSGMLFGTIYSFLESIKIALEIYRSRNAK